jgi:hypothetical protein
MKKSPIEDLELGSMVDGVELFAYLIWMTPASL